MKKSSYDIGSKVPTLGGIICVIVTTEVTTVLAIRPLGEQCSHHHINRGAIVFKII